MFLRCKFVLSIIFMMGSSLIASNVLIIGIAGGTSSGKTTFAEELKKVIGNEAVIISQDCYYKDLSHLSPEARKITNFDHPASLEFSLLKEHLMKLKNHHTISIPLYDFKTHSRSNATITINPTRVIIVEGILLFAEETENLKDVFDIKIYVETADDIRILRRIERDIAERGRSIKGVREQYLTTVKPMHDKFVEPSKQFADIIIPAQSDNRIALNMVAATVREFLFKNVKS